MISHLALMAALLATVPAGAQTPKAKRKSGSTKAAAISTPKPVPASVQNFKVLRTADCVLGIKGEIVRSIKINDFLVVSKDPVNQGGEAAGSSTAQKAGTKQSTERFAYEIPGTLVEEKEEKGSKVRFRFLPAQDLAIAGAQGQLHFEDRVEGDRIPPVIMDASEVIGADTFVFQAQARGGQIIPLSGLVYLRGTLQGDTAPAGEVNMRLPKRPVVSIPLPSLLLATGKDLTPPLTFNGISLWAWPNSKGPYTVAATANYRALPGTSNVTGSVEVTFRVGATR